MPRIQDWFNIWRLSNVIHPTDRKKKKDKKHMIISIGKEEAFDKIIYSMIKHSRN